MQIFKPLMNENTSVSSLALKMRADMAHALVNLRFCCLRVTQKARKFLAMDEALC